MHRSPRLVTAVALALAAAFPSTLVAQSAFAAPTAPPTAQVGQGPASGERDASASTPPPGVPSAAAAEASHGSSGSEPSSPTGGRSTTEAGTPRPTSGAANPAAARAAAPAGFDTHGAIGARYQADGGARAWYGSPTTEEVCATSGCYQRFEQATLVWSPITRTSLLRGAFQSEWFASGALSSSWGVPARDETSLAAGSAAEQLFQHGNHDGALYWTSRGTGTHYVDFSGAIGEKWAREGNFRDAARYGFPTTDEQCGLVLGACLQRFESGSITWSPAGQGTRRVGGAIRTRWESLGGAGSWLGIPASDEQSLVGGKAAQQLFTRGGTSAGLYWTNWGTGTHAVNLRGGIGDFWASHGNHRESGQDGAGTRYGFPVSEESCDGQGCWQTYENGVITWTGQAGARGGESRKCSVLNNGRSRYSAEGADRVALALAPRYSSARYDAVGSHGTLYSCHRVRGTYVQEWKTEAAFGESGFLSPTRRIKDAETSQLLPAGVTGNTAGGYSPTGSFRMSNPFGVGNPGTGFSGYHSLNSASRWGGDRNSWYYNKYVENASLQYPNENMWNFALRGEYRQGVLIDYNRNPDGSVPSGTAGFAIMLHTIKYAAPGNTVGSYQSWGCIAISPERMVQFLREGHDGDRMIMGVESEVIR